MIKYRIRLANGRVIGPFAKEQVLELKAKGHIKGNEEAQVHPTGNWGPMSQLDFYAELMDENRTVVQTSSKQDETFIIDLETIRRQKNEKELEKLSNDSAEVVYLTETKRLSATEMDLSLKSRPQVTTSTQKKTSVETIPSLVHDERTATQQFDLEELLVTTDKTKINLRAQEEIKEMKKRQKQQQIEEEKARLKAEAEAKDLQEQIDQEPEEEELVPQVSSSDSTQMLSLDKVKGELLAYAELEENDIEKELQIYKEEQRQLQDDEDEEDEEEADSSPVSNKEKVIYVVAALIFAYAFLFPGDEKPKAPPFRHLPPQVIFPIPFDKADETASKVFFNKGIENLKDGSYPSIVKAGLNFKQSYENDVNNNKALSLMVRSYGEELKFSKNKLADSLTLFNLIQSKRPFLVQDPNGVIGINSFYMAIDKPEAAADVVAKYLKLNAQNVTQELFASYLRSLVETGKVDTAKQFFKALEKAPQKNQYAFEALIEYLLLNEEVDQAMSYVNDAIVRYPQLVRFQLLKAELLFRTKKLDEALPQLKKASAKNLEYNDTYRAKFLELSGIYWAMKGKVQEATQLLAKSLQIQDSTPLRIKLANLQTSQNSPTATKLIEESRAHKFLIEAHEFYDKKSYENALIAVAKAIDASPGHVPSSLFLAKIQLRLGLARQAIQTLEELIQKYPADKDINLALIQGYIETYKFNDARTRLGIISGTDIKNSWEYASLNGQLYLKMGDGLKAVTWLKTSMNLNPLNDADIYLLAEILLKRANFEQARILLNKAIDLNPVNPDYRILYARMIYETQDDQAAIGYLLGLLDEFGENPKVLAEIAVFYFRAGKVKDFQDFKARLEKLPTKDKALYEFLIKAALLDERYDEVPNLVEELLKIEPGSLEHMMTAGKVLFESGKLVDAAKWFKRIRERMPSYPKVQYYSARIKFLSGDLDGAMTDVQEDIKSNGETDASLVFIGEIYVQKGDLIAGENFYKKAQKINPNSYEALMGLADLSTKRNNFDLALDLYKKAMRQKGDEPIVHKKIGDVYRLLGQGTLAIEAYKLYLDMNPEAPDKQQIDSYIQLMQ